MTTVKRRLADRRARHRALAAADALNRCYFCRRPLPRHPLVMTLFGVAGTETRVYCNYDCRRDDIDAVLAQGKR